MPNNAVPVTPASEPPASQGPTTQPTDTLPVEDESLGTDDWEDIDDGIPHTQEGVSTWQDRNSNKSVIPLRCNRKKQSTEAHATAKLK